MMRQILSKIYLPVVFFLLIQDVISSEMFWMLGMIVAVYYLFIDNRLVFQLPHKELGIIFVFLFWGSVLGIISLVSNDTRTIDLVRDIFYYMNPLIFMYIGSQYARKDIDFYNILNGIIVASGIYSAIKLVNIAGNLSLLFSSYSVYSWRKIAGDGSVMMAMTLAIVFSGFIPNEKRISKTSCYFLTGLTTLYFLICMSRTNIMLFIIMYLVLVLREGDVSQTFKRIFITLITLIILLLLAHQFLPSSIVKSFTDKLLSSLTEISSKNTYSSVAEVQANWRGYETYSAVNQWKISPIFNQVFGSGFGTRIKVGGYAYSLLRQTINGQAADSIAVLHNGYATQLIKLGVVGVALYIVYYISIILKAVKGFNYCAEKYCRVLLAIGLAFLVQTYFLNGLFKDYCFYPMVLLIGYSAYKVEVRDYY